MKVLASPDRVVCLNCRYTVEETADLLKDIGFRDYETMRKHGVTGGDLLELTDQELMEELRLPHLQVSHPVLPIMSSKPDLSDLQ